MESNTMCKTFNFDGTGALDHVEVWFRYMILQLLNYIGKVGP